MATKQSKYVPPPTLGHAAVPIGNKMYQWGGEGSKQRRNAVDVFDVSKEQWECLTTCGPPPPGIEGFAYTAIGSSLFTFGGTDGHSHHNSIRQLNTETMEWRELVPRNPSDAPQKKSGCEMVSLDDDQLVVFECFMEYGKRTDELHVFDTKKSECAACRQVHVCLCQTKNAICNGTSEYVMTNTNLTPSLSTPQIVLLTVEGWGEVVLEGSTKWRNNTETCVDMNTTSFYVATCPSLVAA